MNASRDHHGGTPANGKIEHGPRLARAWRNLAMQLLIVAFARRDVEHRGITTAVFHAEPADYQLDILDGIHVEQSRPARKVIGIVDRHAVEQD